MRKLFEKGADGLLVEVPENSRGDRRITTTSLIADILFTAEEEAAREAEEQVALAKIAQVQEAKLKATEEKTAKVTELSEKLSGLGITVEDLRIILS